MPGKHENEVHAVHGGVLVYCTDRRVGRWKIFQAMQDAKVSDEICLAVAGSYKLSEAGNTVRPEGFGRRLELAFNEAHPGTQIAVIGHDEVCGGMKLLQDLLIAGSPGKEINGFLNSPRFGCNYRKISSGIELYDSFMSAVKKAQGKKFTLFIESDGFRKALEEFNVFLQLNRAINHMDIARHDETVRKAFFGHGIIFVAGIYSPKEEIVKGKMLPVQGKIRFTYPHLMKSVGGKKELELLLAFLGLRHAEGSPVVERI